MMKVEIPGQQPCVVDEIILDLNGTLTIDGQIISGVKERLSQLKQMGLVLRLFTGDTHGNGASIANELGLTLHVTPTAKAKEAEAIKLRPAKLAAIGNGRIDLELFKSSDLRIGIIQAEGFHPSLITESDIIVPNINDALDLLIHKKRLIATLRK